MNEKGKLVLIAVIVFMLLDIWVKTRNTEFMVGEMFARVAAGQSIDLCPEPVNWSTGVVKPKYRKLFYLMQKGVKL